MRSFIILLLLVFSFSFTSDLFSQSCQSNVDCEHLSDFCHDGKCFRGNCFSVDLDHCYCYSRSDCLNDEDVCTKSPSCKNHFCQYDKIENCYEEYFGFSFEWESSKCYNGSCLAVLEFYPTAKIKSFIFKLEFAQPTTSNTSFWIYDPMVDVDTQSWDIPIGTEEIILGELYQGVEMSGSGLGFFFWVYPAQWNNEIIVCPQYIVYDQADLSEWEEVMIDLTSKECRTIFEIN